MRSTLASRFDSLVAGAITPFRAMRLISKNPALWRLSIAPIILSAFLLASLLGLALFLLKIFAHSSIFAALSDYSGIVFAILATLAIIGLSLIAGGFMTFFISLISSPLNDLLAEKTEVTLEVKQVAHWNAGRFLRTLWIDLRKTVIAILAWVVFSLGLLIPIANAIFFCGLALLNTFTYITYPQSRREQGLGESLQWIIRHPWKSLGFGLTTSLLFSIPLVNLIALPVSVVGGTLLFIEAEKEKSHT